MHSGIGGIGATLEGSIAKGKGNFRLKGKKMIATFPKAATGKNTQRSDSGNVG
jgi:hypothetical protein